VPSDLLHLRLGGQSPVLIERALAHGKVNFALDVESPAKDFLFRSAESGDDVATSATATQRLAALRSPSFYGYFNHDRLFSKKRLALRLQSACADTRQNGSRECLDSHANGA
jgi:hypothetical protein